jgi:hypothetical protein
MILSGHQVEGLKQSCTLGCARLDGPSPSSPACFDIIVDLPMKAQDKLTATLDSISIDKEVGSGHAAASGM